MFEHLVESNTQKKKSSRMRYFLITALFWLAGLSGVIAGGVLAYDARLDGQLDVLTRLVAPLPPVRLGTEAPPASHQRAAAAPSPWTNPPRTPPTRIPDTPQLPQTNVDVSNPGSIGRGGSGPFIAGDPNGVPFGIVPAANIEPAPQPRTASKPISEETPAQVRQIRVSTGPLQGQASRKVEPAYPTMAKMVHVEGAVSVEVLIDERGNVVSARALSGHPLLREAAAAAARGWKWNPTTLNGIAVQVVGSITFNFTLR